MLKGRCNCAVNTLIAQAMNPEGLTPLKLVQPTMPTAHQPAYVILLLPLAWSIIYSNVLVDAGKVLTQLP
jgi:hypothetical protein